MLVRIQPYTQNRCVAKWLKALVSKTNEETPRGFESYRICLNLVIMNEEDKQLVIEWFETIKQIATDRKNANGFVMEDADALLNIKIHAKDAIDYLKIED